MITQNHIEATSEYQPLYGFTLRMNPSNRIQCSISPHYPSRGSISLDPKDFNNLNKNSEAIALWESGDTQGALALLPPHPRQIKRSAAGGVNCLPWHLCQTASIKIVLIFYMWSVVGVPDLAPRKRFTPTARLRILDAAGALEKAGFEPQDFYFFTGTLPGSSDLACQFFARNSRPFLNALKGYLGKKLGCYLTFNCWEWQLREKFHLTPALHLHLVICTKDEHLGARLPELLKEKWFQLLEFYSNKYAVDLFEKHRKLWTDAEIVQGYGRWSREQLDRLACRLKNPCETCKTIRCEKSPAAYLSKYVGKGALSDDDTFQDRFKAAGLPLYYPSSWWSISDQIRELIECYSSVSSFRSTLDECFRAYHLLQEILEDGDWDLLQLALPPFIPKWANETRIYRNFYCKSEEYEACLELLIPLFNGNGSDLDFPEETCFGETSKTFRNAPYPYIATPLDALKCYFNADKNYSDKQRLINALPFYRRPRGESDDVDWTDPLVVSIAQQILIKPLDYPELETLEDRIIQQSAKDIAWSSGSIKTIWD